MRVCVPNPALDKARDLMIFLLSALEGAFVLSRTSRSTRPLEIAGKIATAAVQAALPA